jgi:hypothetical protein
MKLDREIVELAAGRGLRGMAFPKINCGDCVGAVAGGSQHHWPETCLVAQNLAHLFISSQPAPARRRNQLHKLHSTMTGRYEWDGRLKKTPFNPALWAHYSQGSGYQGGQP